MAVLWEDVELRDPVILIMDDEFTPFCDLSSMQTFDPRHPRCGGCGQFIKVGKCCPMCCDCSRCSPWGYW